jgi:hypothetical protein
VGYTRGGTQGFWRFTPLAANVCRATVVFQAIAGGSVPVLAMNWSIKNFLGAAEELRDKNERNGKAVDAELRGALPPPPPRLSLTSEQVLHACPPSPPPRTPTPNQPRPTSLPPQDALVARCLRLEEGADGPSLARAKDVKGKWTPLKSKSPLVSLSMKYTKPVRSEPR